MDLVMHMKINSKYLLLTILFSMTSCSILETSSCGEDISLSEKESNSIVTPSTPSDSSSLDTSTPSESTTPGDNSSPSETPSTGENSSPSISDGPIINGDLNVNIGGNTSEKI